MNPYQFPDTNHTQQNEPNGFGITGFVFSLLGFFALGMICGLLGIIFSAIGLSQPNKSKGLAIAGLIIGIFDVLIMFIYLMVMLNR